MFKWKQIKILVRFQSHQFQTRTNHQIQSDHTVDFFQFLFFFNRQEPKKIFFFMCLRNFSMLLPENHDHRISKNNLMLSLKINPRLMIIENCMTSSSTNQSPLIQAL